MKLTAVFLAGYFIFCGTCFGAVSAPSAEASGRKGIIAPQPKITAKSDALAGDIRDPFQADFEIKKAGEDQQAAGAQTAEAKKTALSGAGLILQGVIVGEKKCVALIDDSVIGLGDYIKGYKVIGIKKDRVGLKKDREIVKLNLKLGGLQ